MLIRTKKTKLRASPQSRDSFAEKITDNRKRAETQHDKERFTGVRFRQTGSAHCSQTNEQSGQRKHCADPRTFLTRCSPHNFGSAARADRGAIGNMGLAMRTHQSLHVSRITIGVKQEQISSELFRLLDPNAGDYSVLVTLQPRVTFGYWAQPFHSEILKCQQQRPQVPASDFHVVRREGEAQDLRTFNVAKRGGDQMLIRKELRFASRNFDAQASARSLTLPARWGGRGGWSVGFAFHEGASRV